MKFPAIGLIETKSIARGILVHDVMLKKAKIQVIQSNSICPGKYVVLIGGQEADVKEAMDEGLHYGGHAVVDSLFIPNISADILPAMVGGNHDINVDSVVIVETFSVASAVDLSDMVLKRFDVRLLDLRLAQGLGGKAFAIITGPLHQVEGISEYLLKMAEPGMLTNIELIQAPHKNLAMAIGGRIL